MGPNALQGDLPLPLLVLKNEELSHNIDLMAHWCSSRGISLAPHVKTTIAPAIVERQLAAGAWGITVASAQQARVMRRVDTPNIVIANEVVDTASLRQLAELARDDAAPVYCLVDSEVGFELLEQLEVPLNVLIEVGVGGARAGCRDDTLVATLAERLRAAPRLRLVGLEAFEGVVGEAAQVDALMKRIGQLAVELDARGAFADAGEILLTAGGSAYFDRVSEGLRDVRLGKPVRIVIRSGCYVTHDHGFYERLSPLGARAAAERFVPALELWATVLSRPESDLVVLGFGKRDISYDIDLPQVIGVRRDGRTERESGTTVVALYDQHAVARTSRSDLTVGDLVQVGMSHPCTSFDKWRSIPLVSPTYDVLDVVETIFREEAT